MKKNKILVVLLGMFIVSPVVSQDLLRIDEAIKITVEKNYDVRIGKNNTNISNIERGLLNKGYLPKVSVSGGVNYADETQNVTFADGTSTKVNNAITESYNASLTAEYTIFDGLERKFNAKRNDENFNLKKIEERQLIENTIVSLYDTYYNVAYQKQITDNLLLNIENSKDRLERAKRKLKYGQGTKLDELNAQVDLNNDSISYESAYKDYKNLKRNLNLLLGRDVNQEYNIDTTVVFSEKLNEDQILESAMSNNVRSILNQQNVLLSELEIKINKAKFLPKVNGSASYNWNESKNPVTSFALNNESYGVNLGLSLSWNLFDGGKNRTKIRTSKITKQNREIELYKAQEELKTEVYNAYEDYSNKQFVLKAEDKNIITSELSFNKTQKQFTLGQVSAIEFRQAQINLFNARNNYAKAKYDLKIAEINLLQLAGILFE
ncbi:TolC family protein [Aquimarina litoralis]|uniref:TolC family protein n=1 Tax=Aquimarina litoralis TaxID=584605 RepID=UPI001C5927BD|nr:TolC family protein [Aquimarina litoralis]MBW1294116.1 TolC family protein [Aquimarina litoralis]